MLDVRLIRNDPDAVRAGLARRGEDPSVIDRVHELDAELRSLAAKRDSLRAEIRVISNEVGKLFREQRKDEASELQEQSRLLGAEEKALDQRADELQGELRDQLLRIPNLPAVDGPDGAAQHEHRSACRGFGWGRHPGCLAAVRWVAASHLYCPIRRSPGPSSRCTGRFRAIAAEPGHLAIGHGHRRCVGCTGRTGSDVVVPAAAGGRRARLGVGRV